ncbi:DNA-binding Lrp family transcriptional regulator [Spinactinospora alkalitolerans]|uniref:DNA-binding Lrp family transcriptional regulator n=1 Tax=Spinactinospora alkalitolerans TaxID=687207 RepID=A0A852TTS5_9ACTN|nr:Lrp/AsnC family transcriptional regulator [Spinactinospora alkalitolerans]NYE47061.1 DNA-binding Lrp family transcriptional regulator [Spinactinospora alkalitolerans]
MPQELDGLDRRIMAALQVDGRAPWRRIAAVLGEPERSVARRGNRLLERGLVTVIGLCIGGEPVIVRSRHASGGLRMGGTALARRSDTTFSYAVTGTADCVTELFCAPERLLALTVDELPGLPGVVGVETLPVLHYYRTVHEWFPGVLTSDETAGLCEFEPITPTAQNPPPDSLSEVDHAILRGLSGNGRLTHEVLGRMAGVSEPTARRRVESLRASGLVHLRAVVEPALLGLPVEALLWIKAAPHATDEIGHGLLESTWVRYAAVLMGEYQILCHVAAPSKAELHDFISRGAWSRRAAAVDTSLIVSPFKRSGVLRSR